MTGAHHLLVGWKESLNFPGELQIPPLRFAPVGMTRGERGRTLVVAIWMERESQLSGRTADPSITLRSSRDDKGRVESHVGGCYSDGVGVSSRALRTQLARRIEARDLIRIHFFPYLQHQMGICFFEFRPCLRYAINLGEESTFLERLGATQAFQL